MPKRIDLTVSGLRRSDRIKSMNLAEAEAMKWTVHVPFNTTAAKPLGVLLSSMSNVEMQHWKAKPPSQTSCKHWLHKQVRRTYRTLQQYSWKAFLFLLTDTIIQLNISHLNEWSSQTKWTLSRQLEKGIQAHESCKHHWSVVYRMTLPKRRQTHQSNIVSQEWPDGTLLEIKAQTRAHGGIQ